MDPQTKAGEALIKAAGKENLNAVNKLIAKGVVDVNYQDANGNTALIEAVSTQNHEIVGRLLKAGANVALKDKHDRTALMYAAMGLNRQILEDVFFEAPDDQQLAIADYVDENGKTALIHAADGGGNNNVLFLLKRGADPNIADTKNGWTALFYSLLNEQSIAVIKEFIQRGAKTEIDKVGMAGSKWSALIFALTEAPSGGEKYAYEILKAPWVNVNAVDPTDDGDDNTALHYAVKQNRSIGLITTLLDKGADINARNINEETPLLLLGQENMPEEERIERTRLLLDRGADINAADEAGTTPLMLAVVGEQVDIVKLLLERGAKKDLQTFDGETALDIAEQTENEELIALLRGEEAAPTTVEMWAGYTQSDAQFFDSIVENEESMYRKTFCPICLQHGEWGVNCKYLDHRCKPAFRHERLYNLYKNDSGSIVWCAVCGRHAVGHAHYALTDGSETSLPERMPYQPGAHVYKPESCPLEGGGGPDEKIRRVDGILKQVCEVQKDVGKRPNKEVRNELIEAAWRAAGGDIPDVVKEIKEAKKFKNYCDLPTSLATPAAAAPDIPNPNPLPTAKGPGMSAISLDDCDQTYEFVHVQPDGSKFTHQLICKDDLRNMISSSGGTEDKCPIEPECKGVLHPEEIKEIFADDVDFYTKYKDRFNDRNKKGGARGGSVTTPFDDVQCALPEKKKAGRTYRKIKKTRRGKRGTYRRRL